MFRMSVIIALLIGVPIAAQVTAEPNGDPASESSAEQPSGDPSVSEVQVLRPGPTLIFQMAVPLQARPDEPRSAEIVALPPVEEVSVFLRSESPLRPADRPVVLLSSEGPASQPQGAWQPSTYLVPTDAMPVRSQSPPDEPATFAGSHGFVSPGDGNGSVEVVEAGEGASDLDGAYCPHCLATGRIECECEVCKPTLREEIQTFHAAHHPAYYLERPFGTRLRGTINAHIARGIAESLVLYHYDFEQGDQRGELSHRGMYQLRKFVPQLRQHGLRLMIQTTPGNPTLDDARRMSVAETLRQIDPDFADAESWVVAGYPPAIGLAGEDALRIDANHIFNTEQRGGVTGGSSGGSDSAIPEINGR